jgi:hypothetical protein
VSALDNCIDWSDSDRRKLVFTSYSLADLTPIGFNWCLVDGFSGFGAKHLCKKQLGNLKFVNDKAAKFMTAATVREGNRQPIVIDHAAELPT